MYCIRCGVELADSEVKCPLCSTVPYHPEIAMTEGAPLYPNDRKPPAKANPWSVLVFVTTLFLISILITFLCDFQVSKSVTWSGYVMGAAFVGYVIAVLPYWFRKRNPVIFVPSGFVAVGLYLLYISLYTGGGWFLSFAFPLVAGIGLIVTAVVTLLRYVHRGHLYIFGGAFLAMGLFIPVIELLANFTFHRAGFAGWSFYPLIALVLFGAMLIFLAICRPARETMERKFFL